MRLELFQQRDQTRRQSSRHSVRQDRRSTRNIDHARLVKEVRRAIVDTCQAMVCLACSSTSRLSNRSWSRPLAVPRHRYPPMDPRSQRARPWPDRHQRVPGRPTRSATKPGARTFLERICSVPVGLAASDKTRMKTPEGELSARTSEDLDAVVMERPGRPELTAAFPAMLVLLKYTVTIVARPFSATCDLTTHPLRPEEIA